MYISVKILTHVNDIFICFSGSNVLGSYAAEKRDVTSKTWLLQGRTLNLFTLAHA